MQELSKSEFKIVAKSDHLAKIQGVHSTDNLSDRSQSVRTRKIIVLSPRNDKLTQSISRLKFETARSQREKRQKMKIESELLAVDLFLKEQKEEALRVIMLMEKKAKISRSKFRRPREA